MQQPLFELPSDWRPPSLGDVPDWNRFDRIALDCETRDENLKQLGPGVRRGGYTVGWAIGFDGGPSHYLPIRHQGGDNLPPEQVLAYMKHNAKHFKGEIVGANLSYDLDYAADDEIEFHSDVKFRDIQIADPIIYELHRSYSLFNIGERWGVKGKEEDLLLEAGQHYGVDPKGSLWKLPARYVGGYAENDVSSPLQIYKQQEAVIKQQNLQGIFDLESDVLPVLVRMRRRGVRIDFDRLDRIETEAWKNEQEALAEVHRLSGVNIGVDNVWKPGAIAPALEAIGVKLKRTASGAPQINADLLDNMEHPIGGFIRKARQSNKIRTTFCKSIRTYEVNGRIHCTFNQIAREDEKGDQKGVRYGRLSATDPNMQQQPSPDRNHAEFAKAWREIYLPEEDSTWGCNDFSQQEPRWTTAYAEMMKLPRASEVAQNYRDNPALDNHHMMTLLIHGQELIDSWEPPVYKKNRAYAKDIFLGLCYGEGGAKMCRNLGLPTRFGLIERWGRERTVRYFPTRHEAMKAKMAEHSDGFIREMAGEEGQRILDQFDQEVPYVRKLAQAATRRAKTRGYVTTYLGRRLHFPRKDDGQVDWPHKALNRIIQGSGADQTKKALVDMDRAGHYIQLQVHDEVDGSYESPKHAEAAAAIMREAVVIAIPFKVDTECGPNWGALH